MNSAKLKRGLSNFDRLPWRRKRTQTWSSVPLTEFEKINGYRNDLTLATIPESDSVKSSEMNSPQRLRAETITDLRSTHVQDEQLRTIILDVLTSYLGQFSEYNHNLFGRLGPLLSELIKVRVEEESTRETHAQYKIVSQVYIGAVVDGGIDVATQCLWTPCCDRFASASYGTKTLFAVGIVFAVQL